MIRIEGRFELKLISADALASYMATRGFTVRSLADATGGAHRRSAIGHLRSGKRTTCDLDLAKRIERVLNAPSGSLFMPSVSRVSREVAPMPRGARPVIATPAPPDDNTTDGANTVIVYAAAITGGTLVEQAQYNEGERSRSFDILAAAGTAPPATSGFAGRASSAPGEHASGKEVAGAPVW